MQSGNSRNGFILLLLFRVFILLVLFSNSSAQSSALLNRNGEITFTSSKHHSSFHPEHYLRIGIPVTMVGYGFIALGNEQFNDWDVSIKNEVTEDHPHFSFRLDDYLQYAPAAAVYALNLSEIRGKNNFRDRTIILGISALTEAITVNSVKHLSHVQKPYGGSYLAFPSGHTATAFATAEFLRQEYKDVSPWIGVAGYAAASVTGALRIYNNRHWFSDVIAGAGVGILSTDVAYTIYPFIKRKLFSNSESTFLLLPYSNHHDTGGTFTFSF